MRAPALSVLAVGPEHRQRDPSAVNLMDLVATESESGNHFSSLGRSTVIGALLQALIIAAGCEVRVSTLFTAYSGC